nr:histidine kinase [uncultured Chitinophaga sp.]
MDHLQKTILYCLCVPLLVACRQGTGDTVAKKSKAKEDSVYTFINDRFNIFLANHDIEKARQFLDSIIPVMESFGTTRMEIEGLLFRGSFYKASSQLDSALYFYNKGLELALQKDTSRKLVIAANFGIGEIYQRRKNYTEALPRIREAYEFKRTHDTAYPGYAAYQLAVLYRQMGEGNLQKKYLLEAFGRTYNPRLKRVLANDLKNYYNYHGNLDSSLYYLDNYIIPDTSLHHPIYESAKYEDKASILRQQGKTDEALKAVFTAMDIQRQAKKRPPVTYYNVANIYIERKDYRKALVYLDSCIAILKEKQQDTTLSMSTDLENSAWEQKAGAHYMLGQYKASAEAYYASLAALNAYTDSAYAGRVRELEDQYGLKARDAQISNLAAINKSTQKVNRLQGIIIAGFIAFALLSGVLFVLFYKRRQLREKLRQAEMEQKLLRSQMEPHFIFNTLAVLQAMIRNKETERSLSYLSSFASLLRASLEHSQAAFVALDQEVTALTNYLDLQALRFKNSFDYTLAHPDDMDDVFIPPMLLQPFVENAIQHGVQELGYKGKISVDIRREADMLHCIIEDNGKGVLQPKPSMAGGKPSLSTHINRKRLEMLSRQTGKRFRLEITDKATLNGGKGTIVDIYFPYLEEID